MAAGNPNKRPLLSESEEDRHERDRVEDDRLAALVSSFEQAKAGARSRHVSPEDNLTSTGAVPKWPGPVVHSPPADRTRQASLDCQASNLRSSEEEDRSRGNVENLHGHLGGAKGGSGDRTGERKKPTKRAFPGSQSSQQNEGRRLHEQLDLEALASNANYFLLGP